MRAFIAPAPDQPPSLTDVPTPSPSPGQVQLRIAACGLNFADLLLAKGTYQDRRPHPVTLGMEVAGRITALGPGVTGWSIGDRVAVYGGAGGLAEMGCFPAAACLALPDEISMEVGAAFQVAYGSSHLALAVAARLQPGETLLVLGAAGGVGLTAVELGKRMGARVIACARGAEKAAIARAAGADLTFDSDDTDLKDKLKAAGGADVVYDPVGGPAFRTALSATRPGGRILLIGFASGELPQIPANHLLVKNVSVIGFWWGGYPTFAADRFRDSLQDLLGWLREGTLRPHISDVLPLDQAAEGLALIRSRKATGKVVIRCGAD